MIKNEEESYNEWDVPYEMFGLNRQFYFIDGDEYDALLNGRAPLLPFTREERKLESTLLSMSHGEGFYKLEGFIRYKREGENI